MLIPFHVERATQAAAVVLKSEPSRRMSRLRLLKLLYIADRQRLQQCARPITGDGVLAAEDGPVLTQISDLMSGVSLLTAQWERYIRPAGIRDVLLMDDPGVGKLTRQEIAMLQQVAHEFSDFDDFKLATHTMSFGEWKKNIPAPNSRKPIADDDVLAALGLSQMKDQINADSANEAMVDRLVGAPPLYRTG